MPESALSLLFFNTFAGTGPIENPRRANRPSCLRPSTGSGGLQERCEARSSKPRGQSARPSWVRCAFKQAANENALGAAHGPALANLMAHCTQD